MKYMLRLDTQQPLVLGTCDNPDVTEIDYAKSRGCGFFSLEEAVAKGAMTRNRLGKEIWLGVNIKIKLEDHTLKARWLGKWRSIAYYPYTSRKPSDKWIKTQLERVLRVNIPLDPETWILFHWESYTIERIKEIIQRLTLELEKCDNAALIEYLKTMIDTLKYALTDIHNVEYIKSYRNLWTWVGYYEEDYKVEIPWRKDVEL